MCGQFPLDRYNSHQKVPPLIYYAGKFPGELVTRTLNNKAAQQCWWSSTPGLAAGQGNQRVLAGMSQVRLRALGRAGGSEALWAADAAVHRAALC